MASDCEWCLVLCMVVIHCRAWFRCGPNMGPAGIQEWQPLVVIIFPFAIDVVPGNDTNLCRVPTSLRVQAAETPMKMVVAGMTTTRAHHSIVWVAHNAWQLNVTEMRHLAFGSANIRSTLSVVGNWGIGAPPILDDALLLGCEACFKRAIDVRIACNLLACTQKLMVVGLNSRNGCAANVTQKWGGTRRAAAGWVCACGTGRTWAWSTWTTACRRRANARSPSDPLAGAILPNHASSQEGKATERDHRKARNSSCFSLQKPPSQELWAANAVEPNAFMILSAGVAVQVPVRKEWGDE